MSVFVQAKGSLRPQVVDLHVSAVEGRKMACLSLVNAHSQCSAVCLAISEIVGGGEKKEEKYETANQGDPN